MQIGIVEPEDFSESAAAALRELGTVSFRKGEESLEAFLGDKHVIFIRLGHFVDQTFLDLAPELQSICSPTTGVTHLDLEAIEGRGIRLLTLRGEVEFLEGIRATPEHTFGLMISLLRNYSRAFLRENSEMWSRDLVKGEELFGKRVGLIGYGRVGRRLGVYCQAFEAEIGFFDPGVRGDDCYPTRFESVEELIEWSEIVVLCASYEPGEPPILGDEQIGMLGGKYLVNTARGELIDEVRLIAALREARLAGVALDVIENELGSNHLEEWRELSSTRNVILTPHMAGATYSSMRRTEEFLAGKLAG